MLWEWFRTALELLYLECGRLTMKWGLSLKELRNNVYFQEWNQVYRLVRMWEKTSPGVCRIKRDIYVESSHSRVIWSVMWSGHSHVIWSQSCDLVTVMWSGHSHVIWSQSCDFVSHVTLVCCRNRSELCHVTDIEGLLRGRVGQWLLPLDWIYLPLTQLHNKTVRWELLRVL